MNNDNIGFKIKTLRKQRGLTQQALADELGIQRATVSNYEIGRRAPHLSELQRIASFFNVGLDYFQIVEVDEINELLARAQNVFNSQSITEKDRDALFNELMKLYLSIK